MLRATPSILLALATLTLTACGSGDVAESPRTPPGPRPSAPSVPSSGTRPPACAAPAAPTGPRLSPDLARTILDRAVDRRTRSGGTFRTTLYLRVGTAARVTGSIRGRRSGNASTARLTWSGGASVLLPEATLRIADDRVLMRAGGDDALRDVGSASGVALDVGRELLAHPFLLDVAGAHGTRDRFVVRLQAPTRALREYATNERRGPVTDLLRGVRSLTITATVVDGRLRADRFVVRTRVPDRVALPAPVAGRTVLVSGATVHCLPGPAARPAS